MKKMILLLVVLLLVSMVPALAEMPEACGDLSSIDVCQPYGECDADMDGQITFADVNHMREYLVYLVDWCGDDDLDCDVVGDGAVSGQDVLCLAYALQPACYPVTSLEDCAPYGMCDANADGLINLDDADYMAQIILGNEDTCGYMNNTCFCDLYIDEEIDIQDINVLISFLNGGEVPEFGLVAGAIALLGAAGFVFYRRR